MMKVIGFIIVAPLSISLALIICIYNGLKLMWVNPITENPTAFSTFFGKLVKLIRDAMVYVI